MSFLPLPATLEARGLGHSWGAARVLQGVDLRFERGQVHALIGRNGAGKSTLLGLLSGAFMPGEGEVRVGGERVELRSPLDAIARGIATVHQELTLVGELSVAENILLDRLPRRRRARFLVDHRAAIDEAGRALALVGARIDSRARLASLSFAEQQLVEIARAACRSPRVLLLDEPTSALSGGEVDVLLALMRRLAEGGAAIVHVTHRLDELARVADVVSVLRDGRLVATIPSAEAQPHRLVELMFGGHELPRRPRSPAFAGQPSEPVLEARAVASGPRLLGASFTVRRGEVLGIAGLLGSGRTELLESLFGARSSTGDVLVAGERMRRPSPRRMAAAGVVLVPEDRKRQGLALALSIADNAAMPSLHVATRGGLLTRARVRRAVAKGLDALGLVAPSLEHPARALSGGNQQKVVVGKWLLEPRRVLLLDEPTKGIDLDARRQLFDAVRALTATGLAVVMVSSELEELHETCDRIVVLVKGRSIAEIDPAKTSLAGLFALAMGEAA